MSAPAKVLSADGDASAADIQRAEKPALQKTSTDRPALASPAAGPPAAGSPAAGSPAAENTETTVVKTATVTSIQSANPAIGTPLAETPASDAPSTQGNQINSSEQSESPNNLIKRTVDEIYDLMAEVHEIREELLAHGIHFHMLNAIIEVGVQDKQKEFRELISSALDASETAFGPQAIQQEELENHLQEIIVLEKDLRHVRSVAKRQGVHMQALNHLTQLMRLNPGDKGVQAINTFVAYADAAGVPLDRLDDIRAQYKDGSKSVLPDISRELTDDSRDSLKQLLNNILIGLAITGIMMWFVL